MIPPPDWVPTEDQRKICQIKCPIAWRRACITWFPQLPLELSILINDHVEFRDCEPPKDEIYKMLGYSDDPEKNQILDVIFHKRRCVEKTVDFSTASDFDIVCAIIYFSGMLLRFPDFVDNERCVALAMCSAFPKSIQWASDRLRSDKQFLMQTIPLISGQGILQYLEPSLRDDKELVLTVLQNSASYLAESDLEFTSDRLKSDPQVVERALHSDNSGTAFLFAGENLKNDRAFLGSMIKMFPSIIRYVDWDPWLYWDIELVCSALSRKGDLIIDLSYFFKDNEDCIVTATRSWRHALGQASTRLQNDSDLVGQIVKIDGRAIQFAGIDVRNDYRVAHPAVRNRPESLEYLSPGLQDEFEIVMYCVQQNGRLICFASSRLRNCIEIVQAALKTHTAAIKWTDVDNPIRDDAKVMASIITDDHGLLDCASRSLRETDSFMRAFLPFDASKVLSLSGPRLQDNTAFVEAALKRSGHALKFASPRLKGDERLVRIACHRATGAFEHASMTLRDNEEFVFELSKSTPYILKYASKRLKNNYILYNRIMKQTRTLHPQQQE